VEPESTDLAKPIAPHTAALGRLTPSWAWSAVAAALLAGAAVASLFLAQQAELRETAAALEDLRQARFDLARGLAQASNPAHPAPASERARAGRLMSHAAAVLHELSSGEGSLSDLAARLRSDAAVFRAHLAEWNGQAPPSTLTTAGLRIAYQRLEAGAEGLDDAMRVELAASQTRNRRLLLIGAAAAALLVAAACVAVLRCNRNTSPSPRAAPAGAPSMEASARRGASESELRESEERHRALVESMADGVFVAQDHRFVYANDALPRMLGYTHEEFIGRPFSEVVAPEYLALWTSRFEQRIGAGEEPPRHYEVSFLDRHGQAVPVELRASRYRHHGRPAVLGIVRDVSERHRADAALREREEIYSAIVNQAADGIVLIDMNSARFVEFNDVACGALGYTRDEFARLSLPDVFVGSAEELQRLSKAVLDAPGGLQFDVRHRCRDGSVREVYVSARIIWLRGQAYSAAIWRDITEERRAAAALRESEHRLRELAESLPQLVWTCAPDGACDYLGPQWVAYTGVSAAAQLGTRWLDQVHPEDRAALTSAWAASTASGGTLEAEFRLRGRDGGYRWFYARAVPLRDVEGRITKWFGTGTDVTERRAAEQSMRALNLELEERVRERTAQLAAANAELETFAYSVSHDLKAPLRGIDGYSKLLLQDYGEKLGEEGRGFIENVRRATLQMGNLIDDLLAYSRIERQQLALDDLEIEAVVQLALKERREELAARHVEVDLSLPRGLSAKADLDGLLVVLRNLLENAIKFTRDARPPRIEIGGREHPDTVEFWVRDNGIGFDMKFQERIFEIFQRLQRAEEYPGTGVGLALVRRALTRMGGRVWCESSPGNGATFFVELPR